MGSIIAVDAWLDLMARIPDKRALVARKLMRMQILIANRTGHRVPLDTEYLRRRIAHAALYGHVAAVWAACSRCGVQATLANWVDSASLVHEERMDLLAELQKTVSIERTAYLRLCPGELYAADIAKSALLPEERE